MHLVHCLCLWYDSQEREPGNVNNFSVDLHTEISSSWQAALETNSLSTCKNIFIYPHYQQAFFTGMSLAGTPALWLYGKIEVSGFFQITICTQSFSSSCIKAYNRLSVFDIAIKNDMFPFLSTEMYMLIHSKQESYLFILCSLKSGLSGDRERGQLCSGEKSSL